MNPTIHLMLNTKGWNGLFRDVPFMPADTWLPLPWNDKATFTWVAIEMGKLFPSCEIQPYRGANNTDGQYHRDQHGQKDDGDVRLPGG